MVTKKTQYVPLNRSKETIRQLVVNILSAKNIFLFNRDLFITPLIFGSDFVWFFNLKF